MVKDMKILHLVKDPSSYTYEIFVKNFNLVLVENSDVENGFSNRVAEYLSNLINGKLKIHVSLLDTFFDWINYSTDEEEISDETCLSLRGRKDYLLDSRISTAENFLSIVSNGNISFDPYKLSDGVKVVIRETKGVHFEWQRDKAKQSIAFVYSDSKKQGIV